VGLLLDELLPRINKNKEDVEYFLEWVGILYRNVIQKLYECPRSLSLLKILRCLNGIVEK
jgi:hypothetical protein